MGKGTLMTLQEQILETYPELQDNADLFLNRTILIQNDSDGEGDYIAAWNYIKPLPSILKIGK